jgi:acetyl coenzyme A synthetase (ADP forming)-like protein
MLASKKQIANMRKIFEPKSIAIVGASNIPNKLGNVLMRNLVVGRFNGRIIPVNPKYDEVLGFKCYHSVTELPAGVDCAIIATPAQTVPSVLDECAKKKILGVVVLSGGFGEVGQKDLEDQLKKIANDNDMAVIGPNCLGTLTVSSKVDNIFFPMYKLERPKAGGISFITQSGAVGTCVIDMAAKYGIGLEKFVSYGNASVLNESDLLEYLLHDKKTQQIVMYVEGTKDGRKLLAQMKKINKVKPIIVLKAGKYGSALKAAKSHTGNIAGNYMAYKAAFMQSKVVEAEGLDELFDFVKIFNQPLPKGKQMMIITNGGGLGVLTADAIEENKLQVADLSSEVGTKFKAIIPSYANVGNPLDLTADASPQDYQKAIEVAMSDPTIHGLFVDVLFQTPKMNEDILTILENASTDRRKPVVVMAVGGTFTEGYRKILESSGVPTYGAPIQAVRAMKKLVDYSLTSRCKTCTVSLD